MQFEVIKNPDETQIAVYKVARVIYAETGASSLAVVEALASMIANRAARNNCDVADVISDDMLFECLNPDSNRHACLAVDVADRGFQMCLRVAGRMMRGALGDRCCGATCFHRAELMPEWATARGYIVDTDGLLFYL